MGWNFQSSIKSNADSSREILPSKIAILFLSDFIDLLSLIILLNRMLQLLPVGIEKAGKNNWDYCWLRGTRWKLDSNHWDEHFFVEMSQLIFCFTFILISLTTRQKCNTHTHTLISNKSITEIEKSITHKKSPWRTWHIVLQQLILLSICICFTEKLAKPFTAFTVSNTDM